MIGSYRLSEACGSVAVDCDARGSIVPATFYRAEHVETGLPVLLKVFNREFASFDPFVQRFLKDGEPTMAFRHPNVIPVYEIGVDGKLLFVATQLVDGDSLAEHTRSGGLSAEATLMVLTPLAHALDDAHRAGLVHGDIRPETIVIDNRGKPLMSPFGVVRRSRRDDPGDDADAWLSEYTAPEELAGAATTPASDIYALTAVLYHCLTGATAGTVERTSDGIGHRPPTLARFLPCSDTDLNGVIACLDIDAVIARGMAARPEDRYGLASTMVSDFTTAIKLLPAFDLQSAPTFVEFIPDVATTPVPLAPAIVVAADAGAPPDESTAEAVDAFADGRRRGQFLLAAIALVAAAGCMFLAFSTGSGATSSVARSGPLSISYTSPWHTAPPAQPGTSKPISLADGNTSLLAGPLLTPSVVPGGPNPTFVHLYGAPLANAPDDVGGLSRQPVPVGHLRGPMGRRVRDGDLQGRPVAHVLRQRESGGARRMRAVRPDCASQRG